MLRAIVFALLGLIIGSFLNVLVLRRGWKSLGGRSFCFSCGTQIAWYDNIPLFSYLLLRGRCRRCHGKISLQYPLVEFLAALSFGLIGIAPVEDLFALGACVLVAILLALAVYDVLHTTLPDEWVGVAALLALALMGPYFVLGGGSALAFVVAGPIFALPLYLMHALSRGRAMGLGDAKLGLALGWLVGLGNVLPALTFAFIVGAVVSVCVLLPLPHLARMAGHWGLLRSSSVRSYTMKSEVPFGPFLIASSVLVWLMVLYGLPVPYAL